MSSASNRLPDSLSGILGIHCIVGQSVWPGETVIQRREQIGVLSVLFTFVMVHSPSLILFHRIADPSVFNLAAPLKDRIVFWTLFRPDGISRPYSAVA